MEKLTLSVTEAAEVIGVSRPAMYNLVHCEGFPKKVVGRRILIPVKALERWLENGETVEPA